MVLEGSPSTGAQIAEALEALGWQDVEVDGEVVTGTDESLTLTATGGPSPLVVVISSEFATLPVGNTASVGGEDLFLPGIDVPQPEAQP